jgi:hypothetical protein
MVISNKKPSKEDVLQKRMMLIKGGQKSPNEMLTTCQDVLRILIQHIIEVFPVQEEATYVLPKQMQDLSTLPSSAILMPSSNALQVVFILLISCRVHQMKSINILNSIMSLDL